MQFEQVQVRKDSLSDAVLVAVPALDLAPGAVRLAVESFALTANNVTYASVGDGFGYWNFFPPAGEDAAGRGIVPVWGHARVVDSRRDDIAEGERVYGYLPMASGFDVLPGTVTAHGFTDTAPHRQPMSPVYNAYTRLAADPEHDETREAERMIFGPLFRTGFLIDRFMRDRKWFGASKLIVTSASSKTAMALASVVRANGSGVMRVGLTSPGNVDFVEDSGLYDKVFTYAEIGNLTLRDAVAVDFAGNAEVLGRIHEHLGEMLKYSCLVGATHIEARSTLEGNGNLPGPKPALFFAPDQAVAFFEQHGREEGGKLLAESWRAFLADIDGTIAIDRRRGLEAGRDAFVRMIAGEVDPAKGVVIEP